MPATYTLISSNVLASSAASVTFSAIPATYTDLVIRLSARTTESAGADPSGISYTFNSDTSSNYSRRNVQGSGSAASSTGYANQTYLRGSYANGAGNTSNTFSSVEIYIPSYLSTSSRPISVFGAQENNTTAAYIEAIAELYRGSSAISSIKLEADASSFVSGSSFYLYGISSN